MTAVAKIEVPQQATPAATTIFFAVAAAMGEVKRIAKDNRNSEQKYDFASIDDFMAMVGPICAKHGLVTVIDERGVEFAEKQGKFGATQWVRLTYAITTFHVGGDQLPTVTRHVEVIRSGPQSYGAAQSYVLKQYYRGLLAIPTGDGDDPDFGGSKTYVDDRERAPAQPDPRDAKDAFDKLSDAATLAELSDVWAALSPDLRRNALVANAKDDRKRELSRPPAREIEPDKIPY